MSKIVRTCGREVEPLLSCILEPGHDGRCKDGLVPRSKCRELMLAIASIIYRGRGEVWTDEEIEGVADLLMWKHRV